jgi:hypothetical protein
MVQFEMQQAQEAKDKENLRQARLGQGKSAIDQLFGNANFDDTFYNKYRDANLNYSLPQLEDQYGKSKTGMNYDLARAGTLRSTMAGFAQGDLLKQKGVNEAAIRARRTPTRRRCASHRQPTEPSLQSALRHRIPPSPPTPRPPRSPVAAVAAELAAAQRGSRRWRQARHGIGAPYGRTANNGQRVRWDRDPTSSS